MAAESQFHVLAVDDSLIDRKLIERLLRTSSYQGTHSFMPKTDQNLRRRKKSVPFFPFFFWFCFPVLCMRYVLL